MRLHPSLPRQLYRLLHFERPGAFCTMTVSSRIRRKGFTASVVCRTLQRPPLACWLSKNEILQWGLLLIASRKSQLEPWIDTAAVKTPLTSSPEQPITWIVPAAAGLPYWVSGEHDGVAVRITAHPIAAALCDAARSAVISTSANRSGRPPARNTYVLRRQFGDLVDFVVPGDLGSASGPSEIRKHGTGQTIRPAS